MRRYSTSVRAYAGVAALVHRRQQVGDYIHLRTYYASGARRYNYIKLEHYEEDVEHCCLFWTVYIYKPNHFKYNGAQFILKEHWHPRARAHFTAFENEYLLKQHLEKIEKQMTQDK